MRYFKLIELTKENLNEYSYEILPLQLEDDICPKCGDQLMSSWKGDIPNLLMQDWDEYEQVCHINDMRIYKCIDDRYNQFYISFEDGKTNCQ